MPLDPQLHTDVHALENELGGYKIYPGTEVLRDTDHVDFIKDKNGKVLVPQPSNDPADPLNWRPLNKAGAITCAILLGFVQGFGPLSLSSQVPFYMEQFGETDPNRIINFIGVTILVLGFSNFLWVPIATQFGRRPAALLSNTVCLVSFIWRARANTYNSFMGACVLNGIGAGPAETLPPMIIADCVFLDARGTYLGVYWFGYFGSLMVGPVVSGIMSDAYGWRSFWWCNVALVGALIALTIVAQPETKFRRSLMPSAPSNPEVQKSEEDQIDSSIEHHIDQHLGRGKPTKRQYLPVSGFEADKKRLFRDIVTPWTLFLFPIVHWSSFVVSWSSSCFLILNLTQSFVFAAPPYNFSAAAVGYTNFAILGGAVLGVATGGPLGDWLSARSTRKNRNIREPEMRLPALWPFCGLLLLGSTIVSVGYQRQWDWKVIIILGYGAIGWQVAVLPALAMAYAIDSYKPVAGEYLVAMTVNKNLWGYGVSQFLLPWIIKGGFVTPIMVNTGMTLAFTLLGSIVLMFCGKTIRGWSKDSYVHKMEAE